MTNISIIDNQTKVRFHKVMWHETEIILAKCFNFNVNIETNVIICTIAETSKKALYDFIRISFKNFSEAVSEKEHRDAFFIQVEEIYYFLYNEVDKLMTESLPYNDMMYSHQRDVIREAYYKKYNFLAMDMGTGKTITSASLSRICKTPRTIIFCPSAVKYNWFRDLVKFGYNEMYFSVLDASRRRTIIALSERFVIINYDIIHKYEPHLLSSEVGHFILDEAHNLKSHLTGRTKNVKHIIDNFPNARITFLSGTPIKNRVNDVFSYLKMINHELGKNHKKFLEEFTIRASNRGGEKITGGKNLQDLNLKMSNFMIRKTKEECLDLPDKVYLSYRFEMDDYRTEYNSIIEELSKVKEVSRLTGNLHTLNIITSKAKIKGIIGIAESILEEGRKLSIFGSYTEPLRELEEYFKERCVKIDGSVPSFERDRLIQKFINEESCTVFIGNMIAAGVGINLTNASDIIFVNFPFTPSELYQSIDRHHRIGQKNSVNVHYTFCEDSIDEYIYEIIVDKEKDINAVIDQGKEVLVRESMTEILMKKLLKKDSVELVEDSVITIPIKQEPDVFKGGSNSGIIMMEEPIPTMTERKALTPPPGF